MSFHNLMGIRLVERLEDGAVIELEMGPQHLNSDGALHGGVTAALADAALGMAIQEHRPNGRAATVEMKVNYLRPAHAGTLRARSKFVNNGRRIIVGTVDIHDSDNRHIATALMTYMMVEPDR